jgi:hypothetical protein
MLVGRDYFDVGILLLHLLKKARLALFRARRSFGITKHDHFALAAQQLSQTICPQPAPFAIVGSHETDNEIRLERRVDDHRRHAGTLRFFDRTGQGAIVQRRQHNSVYSLRGEPLDYLDLLFAIVFAQRALPDDFDFNATRRQFALGLDAAGVNALPKLM